MDYESMTGVSAVVKGKTMKIFINERCYVPFQLRGKMRMRLVKFKNCFIMDIIRIYMIKTKGLQKCSNSDILWTASIGWRLITVHTSLIYFVWLEYQVCEKRPFTCRGTEEVYRLHLILIIDHLHLLPRDQRALDMNHFCMVILHDISCQL